MEKKSGKRGEGERARERTAQLETMKQAKG